ncbi:unnamed protein product [Prorocentrum cordatum]|uniref:Calmodulin n=1 Tax=Prorocentrum cordatum TaxID=2364126 RepID=A0ABN9RDE7_9DINO|nr:unnamed protein product [Polarella glacialis]
MKCLSPDPETLAHEYIRRNHEYVRELTHLCKILDTEGSGRLTQEQFKLGLSQKRIPHLLAMMDLKKHSIKELFEAMAKSPDYDGQVDITTFVEKCMLLKGTSTNFDLQKLRAECDIAHKRIIHMLLDITVTGGRQYSHSSLPAPSSVSHLRPKTARPPRKP